MLLFIRKIFFILVAVFCFVMNAFAEQTIQIVGGATSKATSVAITNFVGDNANKITKIIYDDLNIMGEFRLYLANDVTNVESGVLYSVVGTLTDNSVINSIDAQELLVSGRDLSSAKQYTLTYELINNKNSAILLKQSIIFDDNELRGAVHNLSNAIYQKLTNVKGIFDTKIAYITHDKSGYKLIVSDYDGYNPMVVVSSKFVLASLAWNHAGNQIAYVSWELNSKPTVWVQDLSSGKRVLVSNFWGSNSSPVFMPNDQQLLVTLTKDNGSHIYLINNFKYVNSISDATELIHFSGIDGIDTEADIDLNNNIVFVSNHDGGPQIFMTNLSGMMPKRITNNLGSYNTTPRFSPDGKKVTFINRIDGTLKAYVLDLATQSAYPISNTTSKDIGPSFSPNGKLILFSSGNQLVISNITATQQTVINNVDAFEIIDQKWSK